MRKKAKDIFRPGATDPGVTYVPRSDPKLQRAIGEHLEVPHQILVVSGPTKSGKTVLIARELPEGAIRISGGQAKTADGVWSEIVSASSDGAIDIETVETEVPPDIDAAVQKQPSTSVSKKKAPPSMLARAMAGLQQSGRALVLDDFHYLNPDTQREIVRGVRSLLAERDGHPIFLIAVPHRSFDAVRVEPEMTGRVHQLRVKLWSDAELKRIARQGFEALGYNVSASLIQVLAEQCCGSPNLMQEMCLQLGRIIESNEADLIDGEFSLAGDARDTMFRDLAIKCASEVEFGRLIQGPKKGKKRKQRRFKDFDGKTVDTYGAVFFALAWMRPREAVTYDELRSEIADQLHPDDMPQKQQIVKVLTSLSVIARESNGEPVLDWMAEDERLVISDPYFAFYLRYLGGWNLSHKTAVG